MSDTCIVCLGDLSTGIGDAAASSITDAKSPRQDDPRSSREPAQGETSTTTSKDQNPKSSSELLAHLQPCGHDLHNECLKPWVERANSCPICRASFNLVELVEKVGGPVLSSYVVEERTQVADLDPSMFLEVADEDDDDQPCQACGEDDNEDVLMFCDGCQKLWHTYCVGLQEVPYGHWFCENCRTQRAVDPRPHAATRSAQAARRRTRGQQRRHRGLQYAHEQSWNEVWQSVYSRLNLDLDFPYDDEDSSIVSLRRHRQRSIQSNRVAHDAWLRRMHVAELHGAGSRFRETEPSVTQTPPSYTRAARIRRPSPLPPPQDTEAALAWDAFDQARAVSAEPSSRRKKRKSRTTSPVEPTEESNPTMIKRRRTSQSAAPTSHTSRPSSRRSNRLPRPLSPTPRRALPESGGPSFLQSLLQEVEDSSNNPASSSAVHRPSPRNASSAAAEQISPRPSSPAQSPLPSNHSSPCAMSATPPLRPVSPTFLSSSIQPIFAPLPPDNSYKRPISPSREMMNGDTAPTRPSASRSTSIPCIAIPLPRPVNQPSHVLEPSSPVVMAPVNEPTSPRTTMSLSAKSDVQRLVSAALKPHYTEQAISKDEYTNINRDISRMLYDKIGDFDSLLGEDKAKWEKVAGEEVMKAVSALKAQG